MFLPKRLPRFSKRKAQVAMDFSKHGNRQLCKNVFASSGSLQSFNGLERQFEQRQDVVEFVPFLGGVVYFNTAGQVCYQNGERLVVLVQNTSKCTLYVCKRSNRCFVSFDLGTYLFNGTNNLLASDLHFVAFQNFAERVFAVTGDNVLYFSAVNSPTALWMATFVALPFATTSCTPSVKTSTCFPPTTACKIGRSKRQPNASICRAKACVPSTTAWCTQATICFC